MTTYPTGSLHPHPQADIVPWADGEAPLSAMGERLGGGVAVLLLTPVGDRWDASLMVMPEGYELASKRPLTRDQVPVFLRIMAEDADVLRFTGWRQGATARPAPPTASVYFIEAANGLVKVGQSQSVTSRLEGLRTMSPIPLRLLGTVPGGLELEQRLHRELAASRAHGEWFHPTPALDAVMARYGVSR